MRKALFLFLLALLSYTTDAQIYERMVTARDTLKTKGAFVYQGVQVPVSNISYVQWSSTGVGTPISNPTGWHKTWVMGDGYMSVSSDYGYTWSNAIPQGAEQDPIVKSIVGFVVSNGSVISAAPNSTALSNVSGVNTGDQDLTGLVHANRTALDAVSGVNTGDQDLSGYVLKSGDTMSGALSSPRFGVQVNYIPSGAEPVGSMYWGATDGTVDIKLLNGSTLQAGQEMYYYVKASGAISNGDIIQFAGVQGDHVLAKKAVASEINTNPHYLMGVATQNIANNNYGYVTAFGKVNDVYTTGWSNGDILYMDPDTGALTNVKPNAPDRTIVIAAVIKVATGAAENGVILVRPTWGQKMTDLDDVNGTPLTESGQIMVWNQATGYWDPTANINNFITSVPSHNNLTGLEGGGSGHYYHLDSTQHVVATQSATASRNGYLSSSDWSTFNNKLSSVSIAAGNGMNFSTITGSGSVTLGTPSTVTTSTTNVASAGTHTHELGDITSSDVTAGYSMENGYFYNWYAATDARNIAPEGWHVPTQSEFETLGMTLDPAWSYGGVMGNISGTKLKETGTSHWEAPNSNATNESGFNARGTGLRDNYGQFASINQTAVWWTSTPHSLPIYAYGAQLYYTFDGLGSSDYTPNKEAGLAIRLVRDTSVDDGFMIGNDGKRYKTVKIGNQVWMAENSAETKFRDGSVIPFSGANPGYYTDSEWAGLSTAGRTVYSNTESLAGSSVSLDAVLAGKQDTLGYTPMEYVAPGTSGNVLTSNGSIWTSAAPSASGVTGSGTIGYVPKFTSTTAIGNSSLFQSGNNILIGTETDNGGKLQVYDATSAVVRAVSGTRQVFFSAMAADWNYNQSIGAPYLLGTSDAYAVTIRTTDTERLNIASGGDFNFNSNQMFLQQSTGNLGVGTVSPGARIESYGSVAGAFAGLKLWNANGTNGNTTSIDFSGSAAGTVGGRINHYRIGSTAYDLGFSVYTSGALTEQFRIVNTGQIKLPAYTSSTSFSGTATANLAVDASGNVITTEMASGSAWTVSSISTNTTAVKNYAYVVTATLTLTLPAAPSTGDMVRVVDLSGSGTVTIGRNSLKIMGYSEDLVLDKANTGYELMYSGATNGWVIF